MGTLHPCFIKQLRAVEIPKRRQEITIFHNEHAVVPEPVVERCEGVEPLACPFFAAVTPSACPFASAPWVAQLEELFAAEFDSFDYCVCVIWYRLLAR
jgi:hypothetical protein